MIKKSFGVYLIASGIFAIRIAIKEIIKELKRVELL